MAELTVQPISRTGIAPTFSASDVAGDSFRNTGKNFLHIKNGDVSAITVTVDSVAKCNHGFDHDLTVTVPASGEQIVGPFETSRFNDALGKVNFTYSSVTSITVANFNIN